MSTDSIAQTAPQTKPKRWRASRNFGGIFPFAASAEALPWTAEGPVWTLRCPGEPKVTFRRARFIGFTETPQWAAPLCLLDFRVIVVVQARQDSRQHIDVASLSELAGWMGRSGRTHMMAETLSDSLDRLASISIVIDNWHVSGHRRQRGKHATLILPPFLAAPRPQGRPMILSIASEWQDINAKGVSTMLVPSVLPKKRAEVKALLWVSNWLVAQHGEVVTQSPPVKRLLHDFGDNGRGRVVIADLLKEVRDFVDGVLDWEFVGDKVEIRFTPTTPRLKKAKRDKTEATASKPSAEERKKSRRYEKLKAKFDALNNGNGDMTGAEIDEYLTLQREVGPTPTAEPQQAFEEEASEVRVVRGLPSRVRPRSQEEADIEASVQGQKHGRWTSEES